MEEKKRKREDSTKDQQTKKKNAIETIKKQQKIIEGLKKSVTCLICQEIMTLPQNLDCGHSLCYECIYAWFKKSVTCPVCRKGITNLPSTSWSIQQQIDLLLGSLEEEETKEYQDKLTIAKENSKKYPIKLMKNPNLDTIDQIFRCAECDWELVKGECQNCGSIHHEIKHPNINNETIGDEEDDESSVDEDDDENVSGLFPSDEEHENDDNHDYQQGTDDEDDDEDEYQDEYRDDYDSDGDQAFPISID